MCCSEKVLSVFSLLLTIGSSFQIISVPEDVGEALFLTPLIKTGRIQEARKSSLVNHPLFQNSVSYTGFFTVNETYNKNLFAWFCASESDFVNDPVLLWLQGGPGSSSLFGLFTENGPYKIQKDLTITDNKYSWSRNHSVLYIENPAGTGYSFTNDGGLDTDEERIGEELYEALHQFFLIFPELKQNEFFVTGESYAGKYVPVLADTILNKNSVKSKDSQINLKGLVIGNGFLDPTSQLNFGEYAYQHGLVDSRTRRIMNKHQRNVQNYVRNGQYMEATIEGRLQLNVFKKASGFVNLYNYLEPLRVDDEELVRTFVQMEIVRKAIHVGNLTQHSDQEVSDALDEDMFKSTLYLLPRLLENYRVLLYNGQLDFRLPYPDMVRIIQNLKFDSATEYKSAERQIWWVNEDIAGYSKTAGNLTEILVRNAGHLVPTDQPEWAYDMINRFTRKIPFN